MQVLETPSYTYLERGLWSAGLVKMYIAIIAEAVFARKAKGGWGKGVRVYTVATKNNKNGRAGHFCFFAPSR